MSHAGLKQPPGGLREPTDDARPSDAELVRRAAAGNAGAVVEIWARYRSYVRSVVVSTLGRDPDIDDLVQEVFVGLFCAVDTVRDGMALPALLSRIAIRRVGMTLRRRRIRAILVHLPWTRVPDVAAIPTDPDHRRAVKALYRVLDRVRRRSRLAFLLHHVQGMNIAEVAEAMDLSQATAKRAIADGRRRVWALARADEQLRAFLPQGRLAEE